MLLYTDACSFCEVFKWALGQFWCIFHATWWGTKPPKGKPTIQNYIFRFLLERFERAGQVRWLQQKKTRRKSAYLTRHPETHTHKTDESSLIQHVLIKHKWIYIKHRSEHNRHSQKGSTTPQTGQFHLRSAWKKFNFSFPYGPVVATLEPNTTLLY